MQEDRREFAKWAIWIAFILGVIVLVFVMLRSAGLIGHTMVEREVFENSYQKTAGDKARRATLQASLAGLRGQLVRGDLSPDQRAGIQAQIDAITVQLRAMEVVR